MRELSPEIISREVTKSWNRCSRNRVAVEEVTPHKCNYNLEKLFEMNRELTAIFIKGVETIIDYLQGPYLFILTDPHGYLLEYACSNDIEGELQEKDITRGISFKEDSLGTNAIALSIKLKKPVYLSKEQHYCDFFKKWYCFAMPLKFRKQIIAYLDVSSIKIRLRDELKAILCLLADNIIVQLDKKGGVVSNNRRKGLSLRQVKVLKLLARGMTEQEVANKLKVSVNTIKYHKQKIYKHLNASCFSEALIKAIKTNILNPDEL